MALLADTHVHLLAGLDDGPQSMDEALEMARVLVSEGVRHATALCHQNPDYPENDATRLREAAKLFALALEEKQIPLHTYPTGEVMLSPETAADFHAGKLQTLGGHGKLMLVEMPHNIFLDIRPLAEALRPAGIRLIIAHAERYSELLHDPSEVDRVLKAGCLIQVTGQELAYPRKAGDEKALKSWAKRGIIHMLGSDGHNLTRREPRLRSGYETLARWVGAPAAERIASIWGIAALQGSPLNPPLPVVEKKHWFTKLFGD
jgi:protein-tyrosine phosphatase